jgi:hypothetical protein
LFELPQKYVDTGDRANPLLLRAAAVVNLPAGRHRLLLRARGASRLLVDGQPLLRTGFPTGDDGGHGKVIAAGPPMRPSAGPLVDRLTIVRTVNHRVIDEHAFATNLMHAGRTTSGDIAYPSIGSLVAHQRGAPAPGAPAYMLIGYPNASRGPRLAEIRRQLNRRTQRTLRAVVSSRDWCHCPFVRSSFFSSFSAIFASF